MELENLGLFKLMSRRMGWLTQRQDVLSQNIANANTPDYKPKDLKAFTFSDALGESRPLALASTDAGMPLQGSLPGTAFKSDKERHPYETKPDGNAVVMEEQMMKVGQTAQDYDTVLNLYKRQLSMIETAARGSR